MGLDRRQFLIRSSGALLSVAGSGLLPGCSSARKASPADAPNVLLIAVDDLNDWIGCLGGQAKTPHMDALAARGTLFTHAYTNSPLCGPSRASLLTGLLPSTTGIYRNDQRWSDARAVTIPEDFQSSGYEVLGGGKIFHVVEPSIPERLGFYLAKHDVPYALTDPLVRMANGSWDDYFFSPEYHLPPVRPAEAPPSRFPTFDWAAIDVEDSDTSDFKVADWTRQQLSRSDDHAFFLACGFFRPHVPRYVPRKYFEMYDDVELPEVREMDLNDIPEIARGWVNDDIHKAIVDAGKWESAVVGYLASLSFVDTCVGHVMKAFYESRFAQNTIVILLSDHGYMLGEKEHWGKQMLWEEATRIPLMVIAPGLTSPGSRCHEPVSLVDLYPTLLELCGIPQRPEFDGLSLVPLLEDPKRSWPRPALTTILGNNHSVRSARWRYIRYEDGSEELYDHEQDGHEWTNLASDPSLQAVKERLSRWLPGQPPSG